MITGVLTGVLSLGAMSALAVACAMVAPTGLLSVRKKRSKPSAVTSSLICTVTVRSVSPGAKPMLPLCET